MGSTNRPGRSKKLLYSMSSGVAYQFITIVCNLILPRFIIGAYGSQVNGLINSITQFLGFISLCELGMGAVVQSALYEPLAEGNKYKISTIFDSSKRFFQKIALILIVYIGVLVVCFPKFSHSEFDFQYIAWMILIISISSFAQYYLGINYQILLNADQKAYISVLSQSLILIVNTIICIVMIQMDCNIHMMKLVSSLVFLIRPFILMFYVKRNYQIDKNVNYDEEPIQQKWNGIAQHFASVVIANTPVLVLTCFSSLENISIYSIYYLVAHGVRQLLMSLTNGMQALLGNMYAKKETKLEDSFDLLETMIHSIVVILFSITGIMILPFVKIYTTGISDANYIDLGLAITITLANGLYCIRLPYQMMVYAAGHYKQTQFVSFLEVGINIISSVLGVIFFGTAGVCLGMCIAVLYRMICFVIYLSKNILYRNIMHFIKKAMLDTIAIALIILISQIITFSTENYIMWAIKAGIVSVIASGITLTIYSISYPKTIKELQIFIIRKFKKRSNISVK